MIFCGVLIVRECALSAYHSWLDRICCCSVCVVTCYRVAVTPQCVSFELSYAEAPSYETCLWLIRIMSVHKLAERCGEVRVNPALSRGWFASCWEDCGYAPL
jgi:hypothetical protein